MKPTETECADKGKCWVAKNAPSGKKTCTDNGGRCPDFKHVRGDTMCLLAHLKSQSFTDLDEDVIGHWDFNDPDNNRCPCIGTGIISADQVWVGVTAIGTKTVVWLYHHGWQYCESVPRDLAHDRAVALFDSYTNTREVA